MIQLIFQVLQAGLTLWDDILKQKYINQLLSLQKAYNEEINKPDSARSDAALDDIEFQLHILGIAFSSSVASKNTGNQ